MEVKNLYNSFEEIFDLKEFPNHLFDNCEIIPFCIDEDESPTSAKVKIGRPIAVFPPTITGAAEPRISRETTGGDIPMLTFNGKILGLYLPFHFYYDPKKDLSEQRWGVYVVEKVFTWLTSLLKDVDCDDDLKVLTSKMYILHFALFYHKVEIFVTNNELFEREELYKHHFSILIKDLIAEIDKHAHVYAYNKITDRLSVTKEVEYKTLEQIKNAFKALFKIENEDDVKEEELLNSIFKRMHKSSRFAKSDEIWLDLKGLSQAHIKINHRSNLFIVTEYK